ncbi:MAG: hypothetical protein NT121_19590 [Chloroflexi bacterium]|nr:hypothetical protein [Chloroflexota bacterium]
MGLIALHHDDLFSLQISYGRNRAGIFARKKGIIGNRMRRREIIQFVSLCGKCHHRQKIDLALIKRVTCVVPGVHLDLELDPHYLRHGSHQVHAEPIWLTTYVNESIGGVIIDNDGLQNWLVGE